MKKNSSRQFELSCCWIQEFNKFPSKVSKEAFWWYLKNNRQLLSQKQIDIVTLECFISIISDFYYNKSPSQTQLKQNKTQVYFLQLGLIWFWLIFIFNNWDPWCRDTSCTSCWLQQGPAALHPLAFNAACGNVPPPVRQRLTPDPLRALKWPWEFWTELNITN